MSVSPLKKESKTLGGRITKAHEEERNGVKIGVIEGYGATWDLDRGDYWGVKDRFVKGAFVDSINDHKMRSRQIRMQSQHNDLIGGFPIDKVFEDAKGVFVAGEVNLETQEGREVYALAKQGVLTDFSIGFSIDKYEMDEENDIRTITKATIWEFSVVKEPMNPFANVTAVKSIESKFADLPLANKDYEWDMDAAFKRVNDFIGEREDPQVLKAKVFVDLCKESNTPSLNYLIADVVDGNLLVIPKAINSVAKYLEGEGVEKSKHAILHLEKYFAKMDARSPFLSEAKQFYTTEDVKDFTLRDFEDSLSKSGVFSKKAVKFLASHITFCKKGDYNLGNEQANYSKILESLKSLTKLAEKQ